MADQQARRTPGGGRWSRRMSARRADEQHRSSTPLELFFDLCFVVAVSLAGSRLHHALITGHAGQGLLGFAMVFFAIWWAWMNFTWFASAYDTDDGLYRVTTLIQIAGALVLAAGVPRAFDQRDFTVIAAGYVVMRLAMVGQWLRAAVGDPARRPGCLRYALGIAVVQASWLGWLALPRHWQLTGFVTLAVCELLVPIWAERAAATTWHPGHITERYSLFTLIVLGESVLAATTAMQAAVDSGERLGELAALAGAGLVIVFSMWWLYFARPVEQLLGALRTAVIWGYGHLLIFASAAAVGAGLELAVDAAGHGVPLSPQVVGAATAVPVAVYLVIVWLLHVIPQGQPAPILAFPLIAVLVALTPFTPEPVPLIALLLAGLVWVTSAAPVRSAVRR